MLKRTFSILTKRGVFDIGSGSIKFQMAEVDTMSNKILRNIRATN